VPAPDFDAYHRRVSRAATETDTAPTDAQREAGNYKAGTVHFHGLTVKIEYPKGSVRSGTGPDGKKWSRTVRNHYGRLKRTVGADGEPIDVWVGDHPGSQIAFRISFLTADGDHDEEKLVLGVRNGKEARDIIRDNYPEGFLEERIGEIRGFFLPDLKKWISSHTAENQHLARKKAAETLASLGRLLGFKETASD
jgi:hypothetical protein